LISLCIAPLLVSLVSFSARYAENLLDHLKMVGIVTLGATADSPPRVGEAAAGERVLTLSDEARNRIHVPGGILTHHHAIQYLSFGPPFEKPLEKPPMFPKFVSGGKSSPAAFNVNRSDFARTSLFSSNDIARTSPITSNDHPLDTTNSYKEFDIETGVPQSRTSPERAISPLSMRAVSPDSMASSAKSPDLSTDVSTQASQDWDDGTIKMASNLGGLGSRRFSLQGLSLNRGRRSATRSGRRLKSLRACFGGLSCARRATNEVVEIGEASEEFTCQESAQSLSFGHDDQSLGQHLLTLYEVEEEEDVGSMADMPLLSTKRGLLTFEYNEYVA